MAFVVTRPGMEVSTQELIDHCRERLAAYKYPRHIEFRESLPSTGPGKVQKLQLSREVTGSRAA
jgi:acyl-CoA synthetase (AMP-forming)/AMP-acid ligase II